LLCPAKNNNQETPVPDQLSALLYDLAIANRIVAHEGVLDAFGHVSMRHPANPNRYFLSRSRSPELVEVEDLYEFDLDSQPVKPPKLAMYSERVIHGEIYKARPDVMAVCHHHSPAMLSYCITGEKLVPVFHLGAVMGPVVPFWDQREEFGDTNMLVQKPEEGASLARALGGNTTVLMRNHGVTVACSGLRELVFRTIYAARNAEYQTQAKLVGTVRPLSPGETEMAGALPKQPNTTTRAWEYWVTRLQKRGGVPKAVPARRAPAAAGANKKSKGGKKR
jgi:HCOMODA/2-hydroxy-3-carboxy-muconic semialdehyde decarboxylase